MSLKALCEGEPLLLSPTVKTACPSLVNARLPMTSFTAGVQITGEGRCLLGKSGECDTLVYGMQQTLKRSNIYISGLIPDSTRNEGYEQKSI